MTTQTTTLPMSLRFLSHELRISLTGILGSTELLKQGVLTSQQQIYVSLVEEAGNRLLKLTRILTEKGAKK